jgi:hypothetical protein
VFYASTFQFQWWWWKIVWCGIQLWRFLFLSFILFHFSFYFILFTFVSFFSSHSSFTIINDNDVMTLKSVKLICYTFEHDKTHTLSTHSFHTKWISHIICNNKVTCITFFCFISFSLWSAHLCAYDLLPDYHEYIKKFKDDSPHRVKQ